MKRKSTVYLKFIIAYLVFAILSLLAINTLTSEMVRDAMIRAKAAELYKEATAISNTYTRNLSNANFTGTDFKDQLTVVDSMTSTSIWILSANGTLLFDSSSPSGQVSSAKEPFNPADMSHNYYIVGDFYGSFKESMISVISPVTANFRRQAYIVVHSPLREIEDRLLAMRRIAYITFAVIFGFSLIILLFFTTIIYMPMRKITKAAREYTGGNLDYVIDVDKDDEIGRLAASLNLMASELSRAEENQKKFIANVSHDFRSPLTSIRGYLEAMVDGTIPPEMHEKYLNIVLNETERLTKLTNSLLTLNNLNIRGTVLEISDFDINKVIKNVAATFEGTCKEKKIRFKLVLTGQTLFVTADEEKIKQVLYNLIDNAIKFSNPDSTIKVETTEKNEKVFVSVKDSGIGIPKDSLKLIFDRFYKTDSSRGKDKKGTGLGLSITKEIINAHHENINVISTEGVGTEFIFTLPESKELED
ncbi:MAG: HAMP domain-containing histidine kinase [Lachnospiraceae bacterium]|nr:HAMP domain-containing histidine kinase [Lachnospiraceae bacterium]